MSVDSVVTLDRMVNAEYTTRITFNHDELLKVHYILSIITSKYVFELLTHRSINYKPSPNDFYKRIAKPDSH